MTRQILWCILPEAVAMAADRAETLYDVAYGIEGNSAGGNINIRIQGFGGEFDSGFLRYYRRRTASVVC